MRILCLTFLIILPMLLHAQDSPLPHDKIYDLPGKLLEPVNKKSDKFQHDLLRSTNKYLKKLSKQELKLQRKLAKKDSTAAKEVFGDINKRYDSLRSALSTPKKLQDAYNGHLDSMRTALSFLNGNKVLEQSPGAQEKVQSIFKKYDNAQGNLNQTNFIQEFLEQRQQVLKQKFQSLGMIKELKKYQQSMYSYRSQIEEYKNIFEQPGKLETTVLQVAKRIPSFNQFFSKYSQIGQLFILPGNDLAELPLDAGMQSRAMINENLQQRIGSPTNIQSTLNTNINSNKALERLKNKVNENGSKDSELGMPDYKGDKEKIKPFLKRLELGTNIQNNRSNSFFPTTTDIGLSLGFKASERCIIGIGGSYRMGWGRNWRKITITHEGIGIRTFADWKLKGSFWIIGGWELNHLAGFKNIEALKTSNAWQSSSLAGLNKKFQFSKKTKAEIKLMYDFLWMQHKPTGQPVIFRMGYKLK